MVPIASGQDGPLFGYPFFSEIPNRSVISYSDWKIDFFAFLTNPLIASLLMMGLMVGIYMEMSHPGFGLPGVMALVCLALILLSSFASEVVGWLEILFVALGILLFLVEIFVLPGFGVVGAVGIALVLFGMIAMMLPDFSSVHFSWNWQEWNLQAVAFFERLAIYSAALILALLIIALMARYVTPRWMKKSPMVLHGDQEGSIAGPEKNTLPQVGAIGEAFTTLHPGGRVIIEDQLYDALSEASFIEKGEKVVVVKIQGSVIIVAKK
jgi:membrane-bound serine protease (ClpP class)